MVCVGARARVCVEGGGCVIGVWCEYCWYLRLLLFLSLPIAIPALISLRCLLWRQRTTLIKSSVLNRPGNAVFLDACYHHCGGWNMYTVDGWTESKAFAAWYAGGSGAVPMDGRLIDSSAYPCKTCTCSFALEQQSSGTI